MSDDLSDRVSVGLQLAEASAIDQDALKHWFELPSDAKVAAALTRSDWDLILLGLRNLAFAQGACMAAVSSFAEGKNGEGHKHFAEASDRHIHALGLITGFTSALMAKAQTYE